MILDILKLIVQIEAMIECVVLTYQDEKHKQLVLEQIDEINKKIEEIEERIK